MMPVTMPAKEDSGRTVVARSLCFGLLVAHRMHLRVCMYMKNTSRLPNQLPWLAPNSYT